MNITPVTRTVTEYHLTLSAEDLERYQRDPKAFRADVLAQLNGHAPVGARSPHPKPKAPKRHPPKAARPKPIPKTPRQYACPHCPRKFNYQGWLNQHLLKSHPESAAAAA